MLKPEEIARMVASRDIDNAISLKEECQKAFVHYEIEDRKLHTHFDEFNKTNTTYSPPDRSTFNCGYMSAVWAERNRRLPSPIKLSEEIKEAYVFHQKQVSEIAAEQAAFDGTPLVVKSLHEKSFGIGYVAGVYVEKSRERPIFQTVEADIDVLRVVVKKTASNRLPFEFNDKSDFDKLFKNEVSRTIFKAILHFLSGDATTAKVLHEDRAQMLQWIDDHYCCGCGGMKWEESPKEERCTCRYYADDDEESTV